MFENCLKFVRERKGIRQLDIAKYLKISKSTYSNYENENYTIPLKHLIYFSTLVNVSIDYLFGFTNIIQYNNVTKFNAKKCSLRLRELREKSILSQEALARIMKDHRTNISGYELGNQLISTTFLYELCKKYNTSADYLLGKIDKIPNLKK